MKTQCFLLSMFIVLSKTSNVVIRKCCDYNKDLNLSFLCSNETDKLTSDWIPADPFIINSAKSTIKITKDTLLATLKKIYNGKVDIGFPKCDPMWRDSAVAWKDPEIEDQFYLIYDSDKKVRLNLKRDSVYHTNVTLSFSTAFSPDSYCIDRGPGDSYFAMLCPCKEITCIRKCCYQNMVFDEEEKQCVHIDALNLTDSDYDTYRDWRPNFERTEFDFFDDVVEVEYFLMSGKVPPCTTVRGIHLEEADNSSSFYFTASGNVKIVSSSGSVIEIPAGEHCGELGWRSGRLSPLLLRCYSARAAESFAADELRAGPYSASLALAGIFLALAALAIATSGELEERMGARPQLAHVASLAVAHFAASLVYLMSVGENKPFCVLVGYLMQFFFLASFFWLNIMCVTMSYTFSALRPSKGGSKRERDRRRFRWYSVYAWGCTAALTVAALAVDFAPGVPDSSPFKPNVGRTQCWFNSTSSLILYFYGPMGILLIANLFLFIYTTWRIVVLSRGSDALRQGDSARHGGSKSSKEKQRYILYAKMFSLMGVTWLTEILSWAVGSPSYIWYITDCINLLRAVFIFIIFCWKPRVWQSVKRKFSHIKCNVIKALGFKRNEEQNIATDHSEPSTDSSRCEKSNSVQLELKPPK